MLLQLLSFLQVGVDQFLSKCAIDNNIVITFDYFGDEPRKDMMRNATLCTSWDPCRLSYLYRLEVNSTFINCPKECNYYESEM